MSKRGKPLTIAIKSTDDFAEDKDAARSIRETRIRPALDGGQRIVLDFKGVRVATQSYVHALISDVLRTHGEDVLDQITFKDCTKAVAGIVETVVQYSLESVESAGSDGRAEKSQASRRKKK